ncbi:MAG TPA: hypothetical protein VLJ62_25170, partial [Burkholderiaceae bacterium]|nr:hypothetical protein [Burkholderiaceae bacterium]
MLDEVPQHHASALHARLGARQRQPETLRHLALRDAVDLRQLQRDAIVVGQPADQARQARRQRDHRVVLRFGGSQIVGQLFGRPPSPVVVDDQVRGNSRQPGRSPIGGPQLVFGRPSLEVDVLDDVVDRVAIRHAPGNQSAQLRVVLDPPGADRVGGRRQRGLAPDSYQPLLRLTMRTTSSITGTSIS